MVHTFIFGGAVVLFAAELGVQSSESDISDVLFLALPIMMLWAAVYFVMLVIAFRKKKCRAKPLGITWAVTAVCATVAWAATWWPLHPSNIDYRFDYGASGGWHEVQFSFTRDGQKIEGPWVGGFPLRVSFPDIDRDGFKDIRVTETAGVGAGGTVEYLYLPKNDGTKFWKLFRNDTGLRVSYPPDGQIYP